MRLGAAPCDTVIVRVVAPGAVTVIVPLLDVVLKLLPAVIIKEPLPVRFNGTKLPTVNQVTLLLTVHCRLDVTPTDTELPCDVMDQKSRLSVSTGGGACWVTVTTRLGTPGAVTVMSPVLETMVRLAAAVILNWPLPVRSNGVTLSKVSQLALLDIFHVLVDVTLTVV